MQRKKMASPPTWFALGVVVTGLGGATLVDEAPVGSSEYFRTPSPREAYVYEASRAGVMTTASGRAWLAAGDRALHEASSLALPTSVMLEFDPWTPSAAGVRVSLKRGQQLRVHATNEWEAGSEPFREIFRVAPEPHSGFVPVLRAEVGVPTVRFEPDRDGDYLVRVQPELLRGGTVVLTLAAAPILEFPVLGGRMFDVGSFFGDPREGGRRDHHGVDIFARRGTPAIAPVDATVSRVRTGGLGGKTVWLRDGARGLSLYFAHLDEQLVRQGARVQAGDTVGLVGNSGNARTTPPHLHFGIYQRRRGPIDPMPFITPLDTIAGGVPLTLSPFVGPAEGASSDLPAAPPEQGGPDPAVAPPS
jgi:murein DD-endopeptidase MepM/ murein hydrolase activator NlpD